MNEPLIHDDDAPYWTAKDWLIFVIGPTILSTGVCYFLMWYFGWLP